MCYFFFFSFFFLLSVAKLILCLLPLTAEQSLLKYSPSTFVNSSGSWISSLRNSQSFAVSLNICPQAIAKAPLQNVHKLKSPKAFFECLPKNIHFLGYCIFLFNGDDIHFTIWWQVHASIIRN